MTVVVALWFTLAAALAPAVGFASPSFNTNRPNLLKQSREAGAKLNDGLAASHVMFKYIEYQSLNEAHGERQKAVRLLEAAKDEFEKLAQQAPEQELVLRPATDDEKNAAREFHRHLEKAHITPPKTERQLATVATVVLDRHLKLLRDLVLKGGRDDNQRLRTLITSQAALIELGILTTIAWDISTPSDKR